MLIRELPFFLAFLWVLGCALAAFLLSPGEPIRAEAFRSGPKGPRNTRAVYLISRCGIKAPLPRGATRPRKRSA